MTWAQFKDLPHVSCWRCGSILVSYTRGGWVTGSSPFTVLNSENSVKTFRENSNAFNSNIAHF